MKSIIQPLILSALLAAPVLGRDVPENVQTLYKSIRAQGSCKKELKGGFYSQEGDSKNYGYCGDHLSDYGIMYLQGKSGELVNMDVDCDGDLGEGDGSCNNSDDTQGQTTFVDTVADYNKGITDLNAYVHSFVVLGNEGSKSGYVTFDPEHYGIEPLSIVAVVCGEKMFYGVWGDTNGDDGAPLVGEVSDSLARACYGKDVDGDHAHDENDVLYIAFTGSNAVPGADGAKWDATSFTDFEGSLETLGNKLVGNIGGSGGDGGEDSPSCSWTGHCLGAKCSTYDDCDGDLLCKSNKCAPI